MPSKQEMIAAIKAEEVESITLETLQEAKISWKRACDIAFEQGRPKVLERLIELDEKKEYIHTNEDWLCRTLAEKGYLEPFNLLIEITPNQEQRDEMLHAGKSWAFKNALTYGHDEIANRIIELNPDPNAKHWQEMVQDGGFNLLNSAISGASNHEVLKFVASLVREKVVNQGDNNSSSEMDSEKFLSEKVKKFSEEKFLAAARYQNRNDLGDISTLDRKIIHRGFVIAAEFGNLDVLKYLIESITEPAQRDEMVHCWDNWPFIKAAEKGHLDVLRYLVDLMPDLNQRDEMIHCHNNTPFQKSAEKGHLDVLRYLVDLMPDLNQRDKMIHCYNNTPFQKAAEKGHLDVLRYLVDLTPDLNQRDKMIHCSNNAPFKKAAEKGHLDVLRYLVDLTPDPNHFSRMIDLINLGKSENVEVIQYLLELTDESNHEQVIDSIHSSNNLAFILAASRGDVTMMRYLVELTPDQEQRDEMIHLSDNHIFLNAAEDGNLDVLKYLVELTPNQEKRDEMIHSDNNWPFRFAATNGHLDVLKYLVELTPAQEKCDKMVHSQENAPFCVAALKGNIEILEYLFELTPNQQQQDIMLSCKAFDSTLSQPNLSALQYLFDLAPNQKQKPFLEFVLLNAKSEDREILTTFCSVLFGKELVELSLPSEASTASSTQDRCQYINQKEIDKFTKIRENLVTKFSELSSDKIAEGQEDSVKSANQVIITLLTLKSVRNKEKLKLFEAEYALKAMSQQYVNFNNDIGDLIVSHLTPKIDDHFGYLSSSQKQIVSEEIIKELFKKPSPRISSSSTSQISGPESRHV